MAERGPVSRRVRDRCRRDREPAHRPDVRVRELHRIFDMGGTPPTCH
ncbi:hypothetical protein HBB16_19050 [Pseudonocardia sp. MCCB 268]|nr:hypothetical protein [Pseudonocardia cytotoxica]